AVNALRQTPVYQARAQLLIETDTPKVARLDQMFQSENYWDDEFRQTQYRIMQSRTLGKRTIDAMRLWDVSRLGNGPLPRATLDLAGLFWTWVSSAIEMGQRPFANAPPPPATPTTAEETA